MGQILTNEELKENMKKVHYLYGEKKGDVYSVNYEESGSIIYNGIKYPLKRIYSLYQNVNEEYRRIETLNKMALADYGIIKYDIDEILEDQLGLAIYKSNVCDDWYYYYRDSEEYYTDKSVRSWDYEDEEIYNYYLDGHIFKSYNDMICYDTINDKLYLNYGCIYELDPHQDIYEQISNNTINMPDELKNKLIEDYADSETVINIMCYYRLFTKYQGDLPEIQEGINRLNNLSLEENKEEIVSEVKENVVKRKLTRKQKKKIRNIKK
ncbi:MAG: hypothetical protein E7159_02560 [Firmicutes bacterium]|nr:hypothetical protein [Bacillota bacterium]